MRGVLWGACFSNAAAEHLRKSEHRALNQNRSGCLDEAGRTKKLISTESKYPIEMPLAGTR
jgi:hypothetical protein